MRRRARSPSRPASNRSAWRASAPSTPPSAASASVRIVLRLHVARVPQLGERELQERQPARRLLGLRRRACRRARRTRSVTPLAAAGRTIASRMLFAGRAAARSTGRGPSRRRGRAAWRAARESRSARSRARAPRRAHGERAERRGGDARLVGLRERRAAPRADRRTAAACAAHRRRSAGSRARPRRGVSRSSAASVVLVDPATRWRAPRRATAPDADRARRRRATSPRARRATAARRRDTARTCRCPSRRRRRRTDRWARDRRARGSRRGARRTATPCADSNAARPRYGLPSGRAVRRGRRRTLLERDEQRIGRREARARIALDQAIDDRRERGIDAGATVAEPRDVAVLDDVARARPSRSRDAVRYRRSSS